MGCKGSSLSRTGAMPLVVYFHTTIGIGSKSDKSSHSRPLRRKTVHVSFLESYAFKVLEVLVKVSHRSGLKDFDNSMVEIVWHIGTIRLLVILLRPRNRRGCNRGEPPQGSCLPLAPVWPRNFDYTIIITYGLLSNDVDLSFAFFLSFSCVLAVFRCAVVIPMGRCPG